MFSWKSTSAARIAAAGPDSTWGRLPSKMWGSSRAFASGERTMVTRSGWVLGVGLILGLAERLRAHLDLAADAVGLTAQQAELLMRIDAPTRMSDLADQRVCDPSSITGLVQRLERDGFVSRTVDPRDGRVRIVRLTPKGRRARLRFQDSVGDGSAVAHNAARATFDVEVRERWSA